MKSKDYKALGYVFFSILLLPRSCDAKISSLNILCSYTLNLHSSLKVADQVSLPYKTTGTIIIVYIVYICFRTVNWKTKDSAPNDRNTP
jgi:predicted nucleic acid binding AN1-type Zn finger protein